MVFLLSTLSPGSMFLNSGIKSVILVTLEEGPPPATEMALAPVGRVGLDRDVSRDPKEVKSCQTSRQTPGTNDTLFKNVLYNIHIIDRSIDR